MPFTNQDYLPTYEELDVEDVNVSAAPLKASAHHLGKFCDNQCKEYMLCNSEEKDPRKCFKEGIEVTNCERRFFQVLKKNCAEEFTKYWQCIDHSGMDMHYKRCRAPQAVYDQCVLEKMGQERPELGFFSKTRVHHTTRPKPQRDIPLPTPTPDAIDASSVPTPDSAKYGARLPAFN